MSYRTYISFNSNNKLIFVDSFQFVSSLLDRSVKNLVKDDVKCLSQEINGKVLDLVKENKCYPYE